MAKNTGIEWTDATWNPIRGCSRVSEGCRNCYAEGVAYRFSGPGQAYEGLVAIGSDGERKRQWNGSIRFVEEHLLDPLKWKEPRRIFVNSMSDLFHENVTDEMLDRIFAVMALCPQHTFQILTKRPKRMREYCSTLGKHHEIDRVSLAAKKMSSDKGFSYRMKPGIVGWHLPNVQLGVSVEDQSTADSRINELQQTPAAVRFISAEPLLGLIMLPRKVHLLRSVRGDFPIGHHLIAMSGYHSARSNPHGALSIPMRDGEFLGIKPAEFEDCGIDLDWVIVGGESGPCARPMQSEWALSLRDQCVEAGVPFFFKQWGEWLGAMQDGPMRDGGEVTLNCADESIRVGKKAAGGLLDGKQWHQFPEVR